LLLKGAHSKPERAKMSSGHFCRHRSEAAEAIENGVLHQPHKTESLPIEARLTNNSTTTPESGGYPLLEPNAQGLFAHGAYGRYLQLPVF